MRQFEIGGVLGKRVSLMIYTDDRRAINVDASRETISDQAKESAMLVKFAHHVVCLAMLLGPPSMLFGQQTVYSESHSGEFMKSWLILGPIKFNDADNPAELAKEKLVTDLLSLADESIQPKEGDKATAGEVELVWKAFTAEEEGVDLTDAIGAGDWSVAYAAATIRSEADASAILGLGSDDAIRVWVNGKLVHDHWVLRSLVNDADLVPVKLVAGDNSILLKIVNADHSYGFSCRVLDAKQQAEQFVRAAAQREDAKLRDLLAAGVDINAKSKHGITALQAARIRGNSKTVSMLEVLGADKELSFDAPAFITSLLEAAVEPHQPGIAVLASRNGEILYSQGFGTASIEHEAGVTSATKFRIGSITKQFTSAAILKLREEGKLALDDKLSKYVSDFRRGDEVTLHHLLTHTSGITNFTSKPEFMATVASATTEEELIDSFKNDEYDFDPGEKFAYCNSGYFLLGHIVGKVSGKPYGDYLRETFFEPLGMHDTGVHDSSLVLPHEATGYSYAEESVTKAIDWDMSRAGGAGNIYSTVGDLHLWNEGIFGGKVLNEESLKLAFTPVDVKEATSISFPYGYGWVIDEERGLKRISHSGGLQGFVSNLARYPDQNLTVVAFHNAMPPVPGLMPTQICSTVAETFLWDEMKPRPKYELATDVDPAIYDDYVGRYDYGAAVLEVTKEDNKLMAQLTSQQKFEIYPAGNDKFFWKAVDAQAEFIRDSSGKVTSVRHSQGIANFVASRVKEYEEVQLTDEVLDRYVGIYDYGFAGKLTVRREGNQLLAQMKGQPEYKIYPASETKFFWKVIVAELEFQLTDGTTTGAVHRQSGQKIDVTKIE